MPHHPDPRHGSSVGGGCSRAGDEVDGPWFDEPPLTDPQRYPRIAEHTVAPASLRDRELFFLGVDQILDSAGRAAG